MLGKTAVDLPPSQLNDGPHKLHSTASGRVAEDCSTFGTAESAIESMVNCICFELHSLIWHERPLLFIPCSHHHRQRYISRQTILLKCTCSALPGAPACQGHSLGSMKPDTDRSNNYVACCSNQHSLSLDSTADKSIAGMLLQSPQIAVRTGLENVYGSCRPIGIAPIFCLLCCTSLSEVFLCHRDHTITISRTSCSLVCTRATLQDACHTFCLLAVYLLLHKCYLLLGHCNRACLASLRLQKDPERCYLSQ